MTAEVIGEPFNRKLHSCDFEVFELPQDVGLDGEIDDDWILSWCVRIRALNKGQGIEIEPWDQSKRCVDEWLPGAQDGLKSGFLGIRLPGDEPLRVKDGKIVPT